MTKTMEDLRDRFAMAALTGIIVEADWDVLSQNADRLALISYLIADAMMEARE